MKKLLLIILVALTGCSSIAIKEPIKRPQVVVKQKLILLAVPDEMLLLPPAQAIIDPKTITDRDFALWLLEAEKRTQALEKQLILIRAFQEQRKKDLTEAAKPVDESIKED